MTPRSSDTDACPGALRLHAAADGMLARVRLPGGMLSGAQLRSLRELAEEFGDGGLELTSRANLQIRAVQPGDAPALAARLRSASLLPSITHDNVRNIAAPPLPGSPLRALVGRLDLAIQADAALAALPGKFLFAIGQVPLAADVAAVPTAPGPSPSRPHPAGAGAGPATDAGVGAGAGVGVGADTVLSRPLPAEPGSAHPGAAAQRGDVGLFTIRFAGHDTGLRVRFDDVAPALVAAAHAFLAEREAQRSDGAAAWRLRELTDGPARVSARVAAALYLTPVPVDVATPVDAPEPGDLIGVLSQDDGLAAVAALVPLGRLAGVPLRALEDARLLVVTPWRGVVVADLAPEAAPGWADRLAGAGLAVAPGSPWSGVSACAGRPGCARSLADVRADATAAARFVDGLPVHWAGCGRACGSPAGPHVRAEATTDGYLITHRPAGDDEPGVHVPTAVRSRPAPAGQAPADDSGLIGPSTLRPEPSRIGSAGPATPAEADEQANTTGNAGSATPAETDERTTRSGNARPATPAEADERACRSGNAGPTTPAEAGARASRIGTAGPAAPGLVGEPDDTRARRLGAAWVSGLEDAIAVARRP